MNQKELLLAVLTRMEDNKQPVDFQTALNNIKKQEPNLLRCPAFKEQYKMNEVLFVKGKFDEHRGRMAIYCPCKKHGTVVATDFLGVLHRLEQIPFENKAVP